MMCSTQRFQSTPPMQGATVYINIYLQPSEFQSTPPMQGATHPYVSDVEEEMFQSTPPMQGATTLHLCRVQAHNVSIHAPYAGSDSTIGLSAVASAYVSIHAPYAGSDVASAYETMTGLGFQSTPPMQGATRTNERRVEMAEFQSTPPMQGATYLDGFDRFVTGVSIHAPYAGSDPDRIHPELPPRCFNPRPLCRERPRRRMTEACMRKFQSTPPMQGATPAL